MSRMNRHSVPGAIRSPDDVRTMFGRIVPRYDLMNRIMTGGRDVAWRRLAVREVLRDCVPQESTVLDIATGTGDLAIEMQHAGFSRVIGLDFSGAMLKEAQRKSSSQSDGYLLWVEADALRLPFRDQTFDAVTVAFGLRNMPDYEQALVEMSRVLRSGGTLVCLETTPLASPFLRGLFERASGSILPWVGGLLSGDRDAYAYLPESAAVFPDAFQLGRMMQRSEFQQVRFRRLGLGTVALHVGYRRDRLARSTVDDRRVPSPGQGQSFDETHSRKESHAHQ